jgi:hypothetical protein
MSLGMLQGVQIMNRSHLQGSIGVMDLKAALMLVIGIQPIVGENCKLRLSFFSPFMFALAQLF